jgi:RNA polymerase sigma-70 factor (ECF subfamily)
MPHERDVDIIKRCREGNLSSFKKIVDKYQRPMIALAYRMLGNYEDARDISQEAFVRAYRSIDLFDESRKFSSWLYRIATNLCIDMLRKRKKQTAYNTLGNDSFGSTTENPLSELEKKDRHAILMRSINRLSPRQKAVIVLRDIRGLLSKEVAKILDCSEATVRAHLFVARKRLRKIYTKLEAKQ